MKKKIAFTAYNLGLGGIEKALVSILNIIDYNKFIVTLFVEKKEGVFLNQIPKQVIIIEHKLSDKTNIIMRKLENRINLIKLIIKNYHKYDFSIAFTTWSIPMSILARYFSKNNAIWIHADYYYLYEQNFGKIKKFMDDRKVNKFKKIVFVSNESKNNFISLFPEYQEKVEVINNIIDSDSAFKLAKTKVNEIKKSPILLNISRHDEHQKKLTRLIEVVRKLKKNGYEFEVWMIGDGPDSKMYAELIKKYELESNIKMMGIKKNPYPYYKMADVFVLTSDYEGFPVVYIESLIFGLPIVTTIEVSDDLIQISNNYGIITEKDQESIYNGIKKILDKKIKFQKKFNVDEFNNLNYQRIEKLINNDI